MLGIVDGDPVTPGLCPPDLKLPACTLPVSLSHAAQ